MNYFKLLFLLSILFVGLQSSTTQDEIVKQTFKVWGNCEMCKKTIETAAKQVDGVLSAKWNVAKKKITVKYDASKTNLITIQKSIASAGYDTEKHKATDKAYKALYGCCQYKRD